MVTLVGVMPTSVAPPLPPAGAATPTPPAGTPAAVAPDTPPAPAPGPPPDAVPPPVPPPGPPAASSPEAAAPAPNAELPFPRAARSAARTSSLEARSPHAAVRKTATSTKAASFDLRITPPIGRTYAIFARSTPVPALSPRGVAVSWLISSTGARAPRPEGPAQAPADDGHRCSRRRPRGHRSPAQAAPRPPQGPHRLDGAHGLHHAARRRGAGRQVRDHRRPAPLLGRCRDGHQGVPDRRRAREAGAPHDEPEHRAVAQHPGALDDQPGDLPRDARGEADAEGRRR